MMCARQAVGWGLAAALALSAVAGSVSAQPLRVPMTEIGVPGGTVCLPGSTPAQAPAAPVAP